MVYRMCFVLLAVVAVALTGCNVVEVNHASGPQPAQFQPQQVPFRSGEAQEMAVVISSSMDLQPFEPGVNHLFPSKIRLRKGEPVELSVVRVETFHLLKACVNGLAPSSCSELNVNLDQSAFENPFNRYTFKFDGQFGAIDLVPREVGEFEIQIHAGGQLSPVTQSLKVIVVE